MAYSCPPFLCHRVRWPEKRETNVKERDKREGRIERDVPERILLRYEFTTNLKSTYTILEIPSQSTVHVKTTL